MKTTARIGYPLYPYIEVKRVALRRTEHAKAKGNKVLIHRKLRVSGKEHQHY